MVNSVYHNRLLNSLSLPEITSSNTKSCFTKKVFFLIVGYVCLSVKIVKIVFRYIFSNEETRKKMVYDPIKSAIFYDSITSKSLDVLDLKDIELLEEHLKPGDIVFTMRGPKNFRMIPFWVQWLLRPFVIGPKADLSLHCCTHVSTYTQDRDGKSWIVESDVDPGDNLVKFKLSSNGFQNKKNDDRFYRILRIKDNDLAKRVNDINLRLAVEYKDGDNRRKSNIKYDYKRCAYATIFPSIFTRSVRQNMLAFAAIVSLPEQKDKMQLHGKFMCSQFSASVIQAAEMQLILERLEKKYRDPLLKIPVFDPSNPKEVLKSWSAKVLEKYDKEIKKQVVVRCDPDYITPQKLYSKFVRNESFEVKYSVVDKENNEALKIGMR